MNRLAIIGETDITPYIDWKSFKMEPVEKYVGFEDGNYVEHRNYVRTKLSGSFKLWLCGMNNMDTDAFKTLLAGATTNHVTTMAVYDQTTNSTKAINAYVRMVPKSHQEMMNGDYFDVFTVEVTER